MNDKEVLKVYFYPNKIRLGTQSDGGYVIAELDGGYDGSKAVTDRTRSPVYDCYISAGIADEESFSGDFIERYGMKKEHCFAFDGSIKDYPWQFTKEITYFKKNIGNYCDDSTTDLSFLIDRYNDIFLKMDIESHEVPWILSVDSFDKFKQIVIEFHGINDHSWNFNYHAKIKCMRKLNKTHYLVHAHGNNYGGFKEGIPDAIELTYVNKKCFNEEPMLNISPLPDPDLDFPNHPLIPDINLNHYPFVVKKI